MPFRRSASLIFSTLLFFAAAGNLSSSHQNPSNESRQQKNCSSLSSLAGCVVIDGELIPPPPPLVRQRAIYPIYRFHAEDLLNNDRLIGINARFHVALAALMDQDNLTPKAAMKQHMLNQLKSLQRENDSMEDEINVEQFIEVQNRLDSLLESSKAPTPYQSIKEFIEHDRQHLNTKETNISVDHAQVLALYFATPGNDKDKRLALALADFIKHHNDLEDQICPVQMSFIFNKMLKDPALFYEDIASIYILAGGDHLPGATPFDVTSLEEE